MVCTAIIFWDTGGWLVVQVSIVNILTIVIVSQIANKPFKEPAINKLEFITEALILFVLNCLLTCSVPSISPEAREYLGLFINAGVLLIILLTQLYIWKTNVRSFQIYCRKKH